MLLKFMAISATDYLYRSRNKATRTSLLVINKGCGNNIQIRPPAKHTPPKKNKKMHAATISELFLSGGGNNMIN